MCWEIDYMVWLCRTRTIQVFKLPFLGMLKSEWKVVMEKYNMAIRLWKLEIVVEGQVIIADNI